MPITPESPQEDVMKAIWDALSDEDKLAIEQAAIYPTNNSAREKDVPENGNGY